MLIKFSTFVTRWWRQVQNRTGFLQQLVAAFATGIAVLALVSSLAITTFSSRALQVNVIDGGLQVAETLASQSTLALLYASPENAAASARATLDFPDVRGVGVFDSEHRQLFAEGEFTLAARGPSLWPEAPALDAETDEAWYFVAPVFAGPESEEIDSPFVTSAVAPDLLGHVRVVMSKDTLDAMTGDLLRINLVVSITLAGIILVVLLAITRRVTTPLKNLAEIMRRAEGGETELRAEVRGPKDVVHMEIAFNTMMKVLEAREQELRDARDLALESARAKGEFAANVSHELRTPLNGVLGMLELLQGTGLTQRQSEYAEVACNSGDALLSLIDDILDFSKNDSGKLQLEYLDFDLHDMLDEVVGLMAGQAQRKDLDLAYVLSDEVPHMVRGDSGRVRQVLINLIGNAIKFTDRGEIEVNARCQQTESGKVTLRFHVRDTGIGIPEEAQKRIFEPFLQADGSTTRRFGGTGLGLAISKQLVALLGGEMGLESKPGHGSCFWFSLTLEALAETGLNESLARGDLAGLRVLAVDDSPASVAFLKQTFMSWSCSFSSAPDLSQAMSMVESAASRGRPYDLILVDESLPGMASGKLLRRFTERGGDSTRLVLMTNQWGTKRGATDGVSGNLSKPIRKTALYQCIADITRDPQQARPSVAGGNSGLDTNTEYTGSRVLVVEDNRANQQVAIGMLERLGCTTDVVATGMEAVNSISRLDWDLVLMDCQMPEMDGFEATRKIRALEGEQRHVPIVAMTANVQKGDSERCLAAGMDGYLPKPLKLATVSDTLSKWLVVARPAPATENNTDIGTGTEIDADADALAGGEVQDHEAVDRLVLVELRENLGDAFTKMIDFYLEDTPGHLDAIKDAIATHDANRLQDRAHSVKGSSRNLGANQLADLCKHVEDIGRAGTTEGADARVAAIFAEFGRVRTALRGELNMPARSRVRREPGEAHILIVEDDRAMRVALRNVLEQDGYRIQEAANGEMAVGMCERQIPDLVLMDAIMPVVDGFTACKRLRVLPNGEQVPVLIVTALEDDESIERAFASGATDYIPKPVHFGVLRQRVARLLEAGRAERHVRHLAYHDTLTGLPNRALFTERLSEMLTRVRSDEERLAVLFLDLDRFKLVNDTLGHDVGDLLLKAVSERIKGGVRSCDLVARLGGDEFIVILDSVRSLEVVATIAEKIWNVLSEPFVFMGQEMYITTSIGVSVYPTDGRDTGELMKRADTAMFRAKESGVRYQFYESGMEAQMSHRLAMESELRRALERDELVLHYQPQAELATGRIVGMEALVRWQHPERGLLPPSEFIPVAEDTGLIVQLGEWVLKRACKQLKTWHVKGHNTLKMAVNLSSRQLGEGDLAETVAKALADAGVAARHLELEITESTIMNRAEDGVTVLSNLKDLGVQLSIDDFGTGYSSLSSLKRFPVDMLKIDRSFVRDSATDADDAAIIAGIVALARSLRLITVAEGVETFEQHKYLRDLQCDLMQGYYLSEPLAADAFEERILISPPQLPSTSSDNVAHLQDHIRKRQ